MTADAIRQAMHATPFVPFTPKMAGGPEVKVPHPDFIAVNPRGLTVVVFEQDGGWRVLDTLLIGEIVHESSRPATDCSFGSGGHAGGATKKADERFVGPAFLLAGRHHAPR
jgi:hypothetical protein